MKALVIVCLLYLCHVDGKPQTWDTFDKYKQLINSRGIFQKHPCGTDINVVESFLEKFNNATVKIFKKLTLASNSHFVFSPLSLWAMLAAVSEGTSGATREELFKFLRLPQDECMRRQYFYLANSLEPPADDVKLKRSSQVIFDDSVKLIGEWDHFVNRDTSLSISTAPLKSNPKAACDLIRKSMSIQMPQANFEGNSVLVDTLNYEGLWTNAFSDAVVEKAPFFDEFGKKIGYVDLMKIKRRVRMTYLPSINSKILELPVGFGSRYRMIFSLNTGAYIPHISKSALGITDNIITEIMKSLKETIIPVEIAIPRFRMTTEIDMRKILEDLGVKCLWKESEGTRNISKPAALPSAFIQRNTVTIDTTGIRAPIQEVSNIISGLKLPHWAQEVETGLDSIIGKDFIADRPFMFALVDSKTYACLFSVVFSQPSYKI